MSDETNRMVTADEIRWSLEPLPVPEDDNPVDVFALSHEDLLGYAYGQQDDIRALRETLHVAIAEVARLTDENKRLRLLRRLGHR